MVCFVWVTTSCFFFLAPDLESVDVGLQGLCAGMVEGSLPFFGQTRKKVWLKRIE